MADAKTDGGSEPQDAEHEGNWPEEREKLRAGLGHRMRALRQECGLTLEGAAHRTGLALSTIHKIENGRVSPSYENLVRIARGYNVRMERIFTSDEATETAKTRMTVSRAGSGSKVRSAAYEYEILCNALSQKQIIPLVARIERRAPITPADMDSHEGEECIYILSGRVELHVEHYAPVQLGVGDCAYYDSTLKHAIRALGEGDAVVFWTSTDVALEA